MLKEHLINLTEAMTKRGSLRIFRSFASDIMAWHEGGELDKSEGI
jgi:hypothetical protein